MKSTTLAGLLVALGALGAQSQAHAITRDQVRMELADAIRSGDIATGESSLSRRELFPQRYPAAAAAPGKTRAQVEAELAEAIRNGDIASGEASLTRRELFPQRYPAMASAQGKTREQVKAELAEAIRTGELVANGETGLKLNQLQPSLYATAHALPTGTQHAASTSGSTLR